MWWCIPDTSGERHTGSVEVSGSIPLCSTKSNLSESDKHSESPLQAGRYFFRSVRVILFFMPDTLSDEGCVKGVHISRTLDGQVVASAANPRITLDSLEYLQKNSLIKNS